MNNKDRLKIIRKHGLYVCVYKLAGGGSHAILWYGRIHYVIGIRVNGGRYQAIRKVFERYERVMWAKCVARR